MDDKIFNEILKEYRLGTIRWRDIRDKYEPNISPEAMRSRFKNARKRRGILPNDHYSIIKKGNGSESFDLTRDTEINSKGEHTDTQEIHFSELEKEVFQDNPVVKICEAKDKTPEMLLLAHNFDPEEWTLVSARNNMWSMPNKEYTKILCYQSKITAKPKVSNEVSFSKIDKWFNNFKSNNLSRLSVPKKYVENGRVLEIDLADVHVGKENVENLDKYDFRNRFEYTIDNICDRAKGKEFSKIIFVNLGDLLHFDSAGNKTTSGTQIQTNGMTIHEVFDTCAEMIIWGIDKLSQIAPVEFLSIHGNHDNTSSYMLTKALEFYYKDNENVTIDASHLERTYRKIGNSLIGWTHGQMSKANISSWLQVEARKEYGETKWAEVHSGHWHSETTTEKNGLIVRVLPSICTADNWHYQRGFIGAVQSTVSFVWDLEDGLVEIWHTNV